MPYSRPVLILSVEDKAEALDLHEAIDAVGREGFRPLNLRVERDMASALNALRDDRPDIVVIDLDARTFDGWALLDTLKRDPATLAIPVVAFSRDGSDAQAERAYGLLANAFAVRPASPEAWREVIRGFGIFWLSRIVRLPVPPGHW